METRLNISNEYMVVHFIILFFNVLLLARYSQTWEPALKPDKITWNGAQDDRPLSCSVTVHVTSHLAIQQKLWRAYCLLGLLNHGSDTLD